MKYEGRTSLLYKLQSAAVKVTSKAPITIEEKLKFTMLDQFPWMRPLYKRLCLVSTPWKGNANNYMPVVLLNTPLVSRFKGVLGLYMRCFPHDHVATWRPAL